MLPLGMIKKILTLTLVLDDFDISLTHQVQLQGGNFQNVKDIHLKVIKRKMEACQEK